MKSRDWKDYFSKRLAESEKELVDFKEAIAKHGLRVRHRDVNGERDVTEEQIKQLEDTVAEYRRILRD